MQKFYTRLRSLCQSLDIKPAGNLSLPPF